MRRRKSYLSTGGGSSTAWGSLFIGHFIVTNFALYSVNFSKYLSYTSNKIPQVRGSARAWHRYYGGPHRGGSFMTRVTKMFAVIHTYMYT